MPIYNYATLDNPSAIGASTTVTGINDTGQIVGNYSNAGGLHGFLLSGGTYIPIDDPFATNDTFAYGVNGPGQIVGWYMDAMFATHGFLYNPNGGGTYTTSIPRPPAAPRHLASTIWARSSGPTLASGLTVSS